MAEIADFIKLESNQRLEVLGDGTVKIITVTGGMSVLGAMDAAKGGACVYRMSNPDTMYVIKDGVVRLYGTAYAVPYLGMADILADDWAIFQPVEEALENEADGTL